MIQRLKELIKDREDKIYANLERSPHDFLFIILKEKDKSIKR